MNHGGDIYKKSISYDFSISINPLGIPYEVQSALWKSLNHICEYPDIRQRELKAALSTIEDCSPENIVGGSGSSELFLAIVQAFRPNNALLVSPCFSGYEYALKTVKECCITYCKESDLAVLPDIINADTGMVFVANPNNPSGRNIDFELLKKIVEKCEKTDTILVIDECFLLLSDHPASLSSFAKQSRKLFVVKGFTKIFSIPGIRIGYVISSAENITLLENFLPEWNMSIPAIESGIACANLIKDSDFLSRSYVLVEKERSYLEKSLSDFGMEVTHSNTMFILLKTKVDLYEFLLNHGILIRDCRDFNGLHKGWYRIAVKDHISNQNLIRVIGKTTLL